MTRFRTRIGLRTRLVLAFLVVAAISAGSTASLVYREARDAILDQAQDTAVSTFRERVAGIGTLLPVDRVSLEDALRRLARQGRPHPWTTYAGYGSLWLASGPDPAPGLIDAELRRTAFAATRTTYRRVATAGAPWLVMAMPIAFEARDAAGDPLPTGLVLYAVMPLTDEETTVRAMVTAARDGAIPGLAVALVPALFAARSVLRPVGELRRAARRMAGGRLDTRVRVKGNDELADLTHAFNESAAALKRSVDDLRRAEERARRFASDVSHELRTPLAGMLAVTEVLDEDAAHLTPDSAAALRLISVETGRLAVLVEDLMEISRFDARAAELITDEVDVARTVRRTLTGRHWTDPALIVTDLPAGVRARLDPRRLDIMLANLIGNALRHGSPPVTVRLRPLTRDDGVPCLAIEVADSGPGIPPDVLPHIFDRFFKGSSARTRPAGGGLGLAIALENARLHGGTIKAGNRPGSGAVLTLELPLAPPGPATGEETETPR
ncbi:HAMP domain-containing sensor histidine kinase [Streptomyces sp. RFCAC02]|uniref:sensor histidine kinase n=1 Tax=Streptomyces sp. RFCAC02 TaxID=2499143 RepID=UPI00102059C1|nr:HAMP domain-containing sensor histidine kinase [Streptomyces sp. RFCAC02]